jgi:hypothetical protein
MFCFLVATTQVPWHGRRNSVCFRVSFTEETHSVCQRYWRQTVNWKTEKSTIMSCELAFRRHPLRRSDSETGHRSLQFDFFPHRDTEQLHVRECYGQYGTTAETMRNGQTGWQGQCFQVSFSSENYCVSYWFRAHLEWIRFIAEE